MENVRIITFSTCQMHQKGIFPGPTISCDKLNIWNISIHFICVRLLTKNRLYTVIPLGGTILSESCFEIKAVLPIFMSKFLVTEDGRLLFIISHIFLITLISFPSFWFPANLALAPQSVATAVIFSLIVLCCCMRQKTQGLFGCTGYFQVYTINLKLTLNFDGLFKIKDCSPILKRKMGNRKTLYFHWPKNQPSSTSYGFARTGLQSTCKTG